MIGPKNEEKRQNTKVRVSYENQVSYNHEYSD